MRFSVVAHSLSFPATLLWREDVCDHVCLRLLQVDTSTNHGMIDHLLYMAKGSSLELLRACFCVQSFSSEEMCRRSCAPPKSLFRSRFRQLDRLTSEAHPPHGPEERFLPVEPRLVGRQDLRLMLGACSWSMVTRRVIGQDVEPSHEGTAAACTAGRVVQDVAAYD